MTFHFSITPDTSTHARLVRQDVPSLVLYDGSATVWLSPGTGRRRRGRRPGWRRCWRGLLMPSVGNVTIWWADPLRPSADLPRSSSPELTSTREPGSSPIRRPR